MDDKQPQHHTIQAAMEAVYAELGKALRSRQEWIEKPELTRSGTHESHCIFQLATSLAHLSRVPRD